MLFLLKILETFNFDKLNYNLQPFGIFVQVDDHRKLSECIAPILMNYKKIRP